MKRNLVLVSLCILFGTVVASAQTVVFNVGTAPTFVANTGRAEVLGQVTNAAAATCTIAVEPDGACVSTAGTIQVLYQGVMIDNDIATANSGTVDSNGIDVCEIVAGVPTCNAAGTYITSFASITVTNTTAGGVVSFGVNGAVDFAAGDQVYIRGVRGRIDQSPTASVAGTDVRGKLTASPSTIASFQPTSEVVAISADPLTITFDAASILQCLPDIGEGTVTVTEGFNIAFVDHGEIVAQPANYRPLFIGADGRDVSNSHVYIKLTGLPKGVTITWPDSAVDAVTGAYLLAVDQSTSGDTAEYAFVTPDQAQSDINGEEFVITLVAGVDIELSNTTDDFGTATGQGRMWPDAPANNAIATGPEVRYNHCLEAGTTGNGCGASETILIVGPCTTNLLFPWVANVAGYDTGMAIANTTDDPYASPDQAGTCKLYGYPVGTPAKRADNNVSLTTRTVPSGDTFTMVMSSSTNAAFNGWAGYIIAICNFQYGHGFAYITDNFGVAAPATAQGYVALVIPDPVVNAGSVFWPPDAAARMPSTGLIDYLNLGPTGEGLSQ